MNMAAVDMDVLPDKIIIDEVIKRYGIVNGYEDTEDERERAKIMDEPELAFMGAILRNQLTTLRNQELVFKNQRALARSIHIMERAMSKRNRCRGVAEVCVPSTQTRLPLSSNIDVPTLPGHEYYLYAATSYQSRRIDLVENNNNATSRLQH
ncbi:hypothetical protein Syun_031084 [Stephania yunnanensis]|uniref:Uncharacterized protein n=1 Tax=Stephania yunnanensis TaxID=152371 RepID=A0AAP0DZQ5_9MAGN